MTAAVFATMLSGAQLPLPSPDPMGYPLPAIFLQALSYFTLSLHFLAMSFTLGGLMLLVWAKLRRKAGHEDAARFLGSSLPLGFSYLVTLGIPPLLFVQVIYGQLFYSSSVLIGVAWILVIPVLITAYALLYAHKLTRDKAPGRQPAMLVVALVAMLFVGFAYVNNITLSTTPKSWISLYAASPGGGNLNLGEPTLLPRYLLFMVPTLAVAGLALVLVGALLRRWRGEEIGKPVGCFGMKAFLLGRVLTAGAGVLMIASLPEAVREGVISGGRESALLGAGLGLALVATIVGFLAHRKGSVPLSVLAVVLLFLEIAGFVVLRDHVRMDYLADYFRVSDVPVNTQWGMFAVFAAFLVLGLLLVVVLTRKVAGRAIDAAKERWNSENATGESQGELK